MLLCCNAYDIVYSICYVIYVISYTLIENQFDQLKTTS